MADFVAALREMKHDDLADRLEKEGVTEEEVSRWYMFEKRHTLSLREKAAVMQYLSGKAPELNEWGYPSYEREERLRKSIEYREFADLEEMPVDEALAYRRKNFYRTHYTPRDITVWADYQPAPCADKYTIDVIGRWGDRSVLRFTDADFSKGVSASAGLNSKVSVWKGNICELEFDGVVNAANSSLRGGGGIDGAIHQQAGPLLDEECIAHGECPTGQTRVTQGYRMPAKYVLHTVGPTFEDAELLRSCYTTILQEVKARGLRSVAFCCVSAGIFGFPLIHSAHIALSTVRNWLEQDGNAAAVDHFCFCVFLPHELAVYERLLPTYFPKGN